MTMHASMQCIKDKLATLSDFPVLESDCIRLRGIRESDHDGLFALFSDPQVMRYWSYPAWTQLAQAQAKVEEIIRQRREQDILVWAIAERSSDLLIGTVAVFAFNREQGRAEIGYSLHADWQGRGLASEALQLVLGYVLEELGLRRIEADIDPRNLRSCRLVEKFGFVREGLLRQRWLVNGEACDSVIYGLLAQDFIAQ